MILGEVNLMKKMYRGHKQLMTSFLKHYSYTKVSHHRYLYQAWLERMRRRRETVCFICNVCDIP